MEENQLTAPKAPTADQTTTEQPQKSTVGRNVAIALGVILLLAIVSAILWGMVTHPVVTSVLADISIIVLALVTIVIGLFLAVLIFQLQSLIALLREEIKPVLESTNQTVSTVRGTTTFVSESLVKPMINAASVATGVVTAIKMTFDLRGPRRNGRNRRD